MPEWWKNISEKIGIITPEAPPETLKDRLEKEQKRIRLEAEQGKKGPVAGLQPGESLEQAQQLDMRALNALLGWKLDIGRVEREALTGNPSKIDGYWFGVRRYMAFGDGENEEDEVRWKLLYFRPCPNCKHLIPTIELGDYAEILEATKKSARGEEAAVAKSTSRLAAYLNDVDAGRADPFCPRVCPSCRKLIRGGTLVY